MTYSKFSIYLQTACQLFDTMVSQGCAQEVMVGQGWRQEVSLFLCITGIVVLKAQHSVLGFLMKTHSY
jgi:hypothetical protein